MNTRDYKLVSEKPEAELYADLIRGSSRNRPADGSTGLMRPTDTPEEERGFMDRFFEYMGYNSDEPDRVAGAVTGPRTPSMSGLVEPEGELLNPWYSLVPITDFLFRDKTEEAIPTMSSMGAAPRMPTSAATAPDMPEVNPLMAEGSTRGETPVSQQQEEPTTSTSWNSTSFVTDLLAGYEGEEAHESKEGGAPTAAYGVKFSLGLNREDFESDVAFAAAVAQKHYDSVSSSFSGQGLDLSSLPVSVQNAVVDLHYNAGTIGSTPEKDTTEDMMSNTLNYIGVTTADGLSASLAALALRRASNWNNAAADIGVNAVETVEQIPTQSGTQFRYLDASGEVVHTVNTSRTPIKFTGGTSYEILEEPRIFNRTDSGWTEQD